MIGLVCLTLLLIRLRRRLRRGSSRHVLMAKSTVGMLALCVLSVHPAAVASRLSFNSSEPNAEATFLIRRPILNGGQRPCCKIG